MEKIRLRPKPTPKPHPAVTALARSLIRDSPGQALEAARREILQATRDGGLRAGLALAIRLSYTFPQFKDELREIAWILAKKWRAVARQELDFQAAQADLSARERRRAEAEATATLAALAAAVAWLKPWEVEASRKFTETFSSGLALIIDRLSPAGPGMR